MYGPGGGSGGPGNGSGVLGIGEEVCLCRMILPIEIFPLSRSLIITWLSIVSMFLAAFQVS